VPTKIINDRKVQYFEKQLDSPGKDAKRGECLLISTDVKCFIPLGLGSKLHRERRRYLGRQ